LSALASRTGWRVSTMLREHPIRQDVGCIVEKVAARILPTGNQQCWQTLADGGTER